MKIIVNRSCATLLCLWLATLLLKPSLHAAEVRWDPRVGDGTNAEIEITWETADGEGGAAVKIHNPHSQPVTVPLGAIDQPGVHGPYYQVKGQVKYKDVEGEGYLEMWNVFSPNSPVAGEPRYFSRTLSASGDLGHLSGTSEWRAFRLPFDAAEAKTALQRLEFNLHLPGKGTVWLSPGTLEDIGGSAAWGGVDGAWWTARTGGIIGGVLGTLVGLIGATVGTLAGRGKAKGLVMGLCYGVIAFGVISLIVGGVAFLQNQPRDVWYIFLLMGAIVSFVFPLNLHRIRRAYEETELKRMESLDSLG